MNLHSTLFEDMIALCSVLTKDQYTQSCSLLSNVSIGEHLRHSIEFYVCLRAGIAQEEVNYDARERDEKLQTHLKYAIAMMQDLASFFSTVEEKETLLLRSQESPIKIVETSVARELLYCLDHAIHHQALIKIGLKEMQLGHLVGQNFGVAYSTLRYQEKN